MNNNICPKMNGAKCAGRYCDLWDDENQCCLEAFEVKLRVDILKRKLSQMEHEENELQKEQDIEKFKARKNVVEPDSTAIN